MALFDSQSTREHSAMKTTYHIGVSRLQLLRWIHATGPTVLDNFYGTKEEALQAVRSDGREVFSGCPTPLADGRCPGHKTRKAKQ